MLKDCPSVLDVQYTCLILYRNVPLILHVHAAHMISPSLCCPADAAQPRPLIQTRSPVQKPTGGMPDWLGQRSSVHISQSQSRREFAEVRLRLCTCALYVCVLCSDLDLAVMKALGQVFNGLVLQPRGMTGDIFEQKSKLFQR